MMEKQQFYTTADVFFLSQPTVRQIPGEALCSTIFSTEFVANRRSQLYG